MSSDNLITLAFGGLNFFWMVWVFILARKNKIRDADKQEVKAYAENCLSRGKDIVENISSDVSKLEKYTKEQILKLEDDRRVIDKRVRLLEGQQMTENKVESKLAPIRQDVEDTRSSIRDLRDEFRSHASLAEMNTQQLLAGMSEIKGYLKAKSEATFNDK